MKTYFLAYAKQKLTELLHDEEGHVMPFIIMTNIIVLPLGLILGGIWENSLTLKIIGGIYAVLAIIFLALASNNDKHSESRDQ